MLGLNRLPQCHLNANPLYDNPPLGLPPRALLLRPKAYVAYVTPCYVFSLSLSLMRVPALCRHNASAVHRNEQHKQIN